MSKICIVSSHSPYSSTSVRDGIESLLVAASFDMDASLLVLGDGILQLLNKQAPESLPQKNTGSLLQALEIYGVESIYVCEQDLVDRGLTQDDLILTPTIISRSQVPSLLQEQDSILNF
ncbi:sulfurtransferase complex subunit TusC [Sansalvadorimonas verongulae]|uniref:sulfurtransferase complex subunit TusC n=1 Tax=Sansalvadorimonas verongulae TaxID=2172824 RepID=UPI0012BC33A5|nr:sulfurtransferase complex subunit TusC [Sansalvadorimonas verongulae]MTI12340.1 sulfurtransferase complex subunit TusC [Sansalvadorimonas verongulae]